MQTITVVIALFALCVSIVVAGWTIYRDAFATRSQRQKRIKGNFTAMYVEVEECGRIATGYKTASIDAPLYRLPIICFQTCFPALLADSGINEKGIYSLLKFYDEVETMNRGLDAADDAFMSGNQERIDKERKRIPLKVKRIKKPDGEYYFAAISVCEKGKG